MTEHLLHIGGGLVLIIGLFVALFKTLIYLDKRGINTHRGMKPGKEKAGAKRPSRKRT
jgi:hypothetical protein